MLDFGISIFGPLQISILKILLKLFDDEIKRVVLVDSYILLSLRNNLTKTYGSVSPKVPKSLFYLPQHDYLVFILENIKITQYIMYRDIKLHLLQSRKRSFVHILWALKQHF